MSGVSAAIGAATAWPGEDEVAGEEEAVGRPRECTSHSYEAAFHRGVMQSTKAMPFRSGIRQCQIEHE